MAKTITLELSDNIYELLKLTADQIGETPEQIVLGCIENRVKQAKEDPLLELAGIFESEATNISDKHDEYLGEELRSKHE